MASWMAHLRIADQLLDGLGALPRAHFVVGNIAPDSGEPNADWSAFSPPTELSHWTLPGAPRDSGAERFREKHLAAAMPPDAFAFCLGYYAHLLTDYIWRRDVYLPQAARYAEEFARDADFIWEIKRDWYDLDHLYYRKHPDFRAFAIFAGVGAFPNIYLDYFSETAFEKRIAYIADFYRGFDGDLDRVYPYFTKAEMDAFVDRAVAEIRPRLEMLCFT
ncbi:MAG: zinc dependent phospholipase C family protein [Clostridiales bacterium]|nr:zinc dependent phospholipase C family protein [Clostridiales bacterium]